MSNIRKTWNHKSTLNWEQVQDSQELNFRILYSDMVQFRKIKLGCLSSRIMARDQAEQDH